MRTMQSELQERNTTLWNAYEHSYNIALKEWLPLFTNNLGSSNSLPHLLGVMEHIDILLFSGRYCDIELTDAELYITLCAALMHDIGKASIFKDKGCDNTNERCKRYEYFVKQGCVKCGGECRGDGLNTADCPFKEHAQISHYVIMSNWADLGIYSERLAQIIGLICCFHECGSILECHLHNDYYLEEYGHIRARIIAALLTLADHLDDTFKRAQPEYFREFTDIGDIGKFRNKVQYTKIDKMSKMICSVLDKRFIEYEDVVGQYSVLNAKNEDKSFVKRNVHIYDKTKVNALYDFLTDYTRTAPEVLAKFSPISNLVGHMYDNFCEILPLRNELYILKMPIKKWYIECEGHLFDVCYDAGGEFGNCRYALEPILDDEYCDTVLNAMRSLSGGVFGKRAFSYYDILNYTHGYIEDYEKVKVAVRRIAKLLQYFAVNILNISQNENADHIYCNDNIWTYYRAKGNSYIQRCSRYLGDQLENSDVTVGWMRKIINSMINGTSKIADK